MKEPELRPVEATTRHDGVMLWRYHYSLVHLELYIIMDGVKNAQMRNWLSPVGILQLLTSIDHQKPSYSTWSKSILHFFLA